MKSGDKNPAACLWARGRRFSVTSIAALLCCSLAAQAQLQLNPFTSETFSPDGQIEEFIVAPGGGSQEYFEVNSLLAEFGLILPGSSPTQGVFIAVDIAGGAAPTGFEDIPGDDVPTGYNVGRLFAAFNPTLDPDNDPSNGVGVYFIGVDISAPAALDDFFGTQPVSFDGDGDGNPDTTGEIFSQTDPGIFLSEVPNSGLTGIDNYQFEIDTNINGGAELRFFIAERQTSTINPFTEFILEQRNNVDNGDGTADSVTRIAFFEFTPINLGDPVAEALTILDINDDGSIDSNDFGIADDVEVAFQNVAPNPATGQGGFINNSNPWCVGVRIDADTQRDGGDFGGGAEDGFPATLVFPNPDIRVTKGVRCVDDGPTAPFVDTLDALPGSEVEFEIAIANAGNMDLVNIQLTDAFECLVGTGFSLVPGSVVAVGGTPAGISGTFLADFAAAIDPGNPANFPVSVGSLDGPSDPPQGPAQLPCALGGDDFTFRFRVILPLDAGADACQTAIDCTNKVSVSADSVPLDFITDDQEVTPIPPITVTVCDFSVDNSVADPSICDFQTGIASDNDVSINIFCRDVAVEKEVQFCPNGSCDNTFFKSLSVPPADMTTLRYRFTVTNNGEVDEAITLTDANLCGDLATAGATIIDCDLCTSGGTITVDGVTPGRVAVGESVPVLCEIRFDSSAELFAFLEADDAPAGPSQTALANCGASAAELARASEPTIHVNCAEISALPIAPASQDPFCVNDTPLTDFSTAEVRSAQCDLEVTKQVFCVDPDTDELIDLGPAPLEVVPGSQIRYQIDVTNTSADVTICQLRVTDILTANPDLASCIIPDAANATYAINGAPCGGGPIFNVEGNPVVIDLQVACGQQLAPGDVFTITFDATITGNASDTCDPVNVVEVECAGVFSDACGPFSNIDDDSVDVDVLAPAISCTKRFKATWDSDADCDEIGIDADDRMTAFETDLDLATADGGKAIIFPAVFTFEVVASNDGDTQLDVSFADETFLNAIDATNGVDLLPGCILDSSDTITLAPGGSASITCDFRVESLSAAQALAANDGGSDADLIENNAMVEGVVSGMDVCPGDPVNNKCQATIALPPVAELTVEKSVVCLDDNDNPTGPIEPDQLTVAPGAKVRFIIEITNNDPNGVARVPQLRLNDFLSRPDLLVPGSCTATLDNATPAPGDDVDATLCVCPLNVSGATQFVTFAACRPALPWLEPGETLTITIDVQLPDVNSIGNLSQVDNEILVSGFADACTPPRDNAGPQVDDDVIIIIARPSITCTKTVSADYLNDSVIDLDPTTAGDLPPATQTEIVPLRLIYEITVTNDGTIPLTNVIASDPNLVAAAAAAGAEFLSCDLCDTPADPNSCDGTSDEEANVGNLAPGASATVRCEFVFESDEEISAFLASLPGGDGECYNNIALVSGEPDFGNDVCGPVVTTAVESSCEAEICRSPINECPRTKVVFQIYNQDEVGFSGTERCIISWDQRWLSQYNDGAATIDGVPLVNHFLRENLQTDMGRAVIFTRDSLVVCGPDQTTSPLLGTLVTLYQFTDDGRARGTAGGPPEPTFAQAGASLVGKGSFGDRPSETPGFFVVGRPGEDDPNEDRPVPTLTGSQKQQISVSATTPAKKDAPAARAATGSAPGIRGNHTQKGSLLVFPNIEIKWDSEGRLIQDTVVQLSNDAPQAVDVRWFLVNGNPALCNTTDLEFELTRDQPIVWSAATGQPRGLSPFDIFGVRQADDDPTNPGGETIRGALVVYATDRNIDPIRWNNLTGDATVVRFDHPSAWQYQATAFRVVNDALAEGDVVSSGPGDLTIGELNLNGLEYEYAPRELIMNFFAARGELRYGYTGSDEDFVDDDQLPGGAGNSGPSVVPVDSELTLFMLQRDLTVAQPIDQP